MDIVLDTNFLILPELYKIDIFSEIDRIVDKNYRLVTTNSVIEELKILQKNGKGKEKIASRIALGLIERKSILVKKDYQKNTDTSLLSKADILCTQDKELQERAKKKAIPIIYMKGNNHLILEGKI